MSQLLRLIRQGPEARKDQSLLNRVEQRFSDLQGGGSALCVPSARLGLAYIILLLAEHAKQNLSAPTKDEIVLPSFTYAAVPAIIHAAGFKPVFADVEPGTFLLSPESATAKITPRTLAVIPTHLFGQPCPMDPFLEMARAKDVYIIEDCAQACGAKIAGRRVGTFGHAAYFSFYVTKNVTAFGGGMITTHNATLNEQLRARLGKPKALPDATLGKALLNGLAMIAATWPPLFTPTLYAANRLLMPRGKDLIHRLGAEAIELHRGLPKSLDGYGFSPLQARFLLNQLPTVDETAAKRRAVTAYYDEHFSDLSGLTLPRRPVNTESIALNYPILVAHRDQFAVALHKRGVDTARGYLYSCSARPEFAAYRASCPHSDELERSILHLPIHRRLTNKDMQRVVEAVRSALGSVRAT